MDFERKDRGVVWNATETKCDLCGRSTTLGACQLWGPFALCEGCDSLIDDHYTFDMMQEERARADQDLRTEQTPVHPPLA